MNALSVYDPGLELDPRQLDKNTSWEETIETLVYELGEAGVQEQEQRPLAGLLYAAFLSGRSLLLAGPYGEELVEALSVSLYGRKPAVLDLAGEYDPSILKMAEESGDNILVVRNSFLPGWMPNLIQWMTRSEKYIVTVYPFIEDLKIEPESLYWYFQPILTDAFFQNTPSRNYVDGKLQITPRRNYAGGKMMENFKLPEIQMKNSPAKKYIQNLGMGQYACAATERLLTCLWTVDENNAEDMTALGVLYPYAYVTERLDVFSDLIQNEMKLSKQVLSYLERSIKANS